jgi:two-component system, response regulator RegA
MNNQVVRLEPPGTHSVASQQSVAQRIVIVEPDDRIAKMLSNAFVRSGWEVVRRDTESIERCESSGVTVLLALPESPAPSLEPLRRVKALGPEARVVVTLAYVSTQVIVECMRLGAHDCLVKPFAPEEVLLAALGVERGQNSNLSSALPSLARMEWEYMNRVLSSEGGNISRSARILGIRRTTLQRKLKKYPPSR